MESMNIERKRNIYALFAGISAILALGHFVGLQYSITLANELDDEESKTPGVIPNWNAKQNIPFAIILALFAVAQFGSSLVIFILSRKQKTAAALYYNALIALFASFSIGVSLTILASEYNSGTRQLPKDQSFFPTMMPFYYTIQVDATATFLLAVPMLLFIFYYNLEDYLTEQRQAHRQQKMLESQAVSKQVWLLSLFLVNCFAHVAFIYNIYQFTGIEDTKDYALDNLADQYTFYIAVEVVVSLVAIITQVAHFRKAFLKKNQLILVATLAAVFQFGSFILMSIKAVQFYLDISLMENGVCYFPDCEEAKTFRWEILGYSILTLITLVAQVPYFAVISTLVERDQKRDTLITTEENYQSA